MQSQQEPQPNMFIFIAWLIFSGVAIYFGIKYGHSILGGLSGVAIGGICGAAVGYVIGWLLPSYLMTWIIGNKE